jgi:hypothetical protein
LATHSLLSVSGRLNSVHSNFATSGPEENTAARVFGKIEHFSPLGRSKGCRGSNKLFDLRSEFARLASLSSLSDVAPNEKQRLSRVMQVLPNLYYLSPMFLVLFIHQDRNVDGHLRLS